jgi:hypothetical protein
VNDVTIPDETRRRLEVLKSSVDVALQTLDAYSDVLKEVVDGSYRTLPTRHIRDIMMVLEHVADGTAYNAYVDGVEVQTWASRLHELLRHEFPDITQ